MSNFKLDFLNKFIKENISNHDFEYKNLFEIKKIYNKRDERNCISLCLFCQMLIIYQNLIRITRLKRQNLIVF